MAVVEASEFIAFGQVAAMHNMPEKTLRRRIRRWQIPTYADPHDLRKVMLRLEDVEAIFRPRPFHATNVADAA